MKSRTYLLENFRVVLSCGMISCCLVLTTSKKLSRPLEAQLVFDVVGGVVGLPDDSFPNFLCLENPEVLLYNAAAVFIAKISVAVVIMLQKEANGLFSESMINCLAAGEINFCFAGSSFGSKKFMFVESWAECV